jgi:Putative DNA-binding domain
MLSDRIGDIKIADIEALCENKIPESKTLKYKRELYGRTDEDRRELVADVTAFANTGGGDIIFGLVEGKDATPEEICGISVESRDQEERRLGDIIRTGTEPRYTSFEFRWVETKSEKSILILRAARSWNGPHRVTLRSHDKFYVRDSRGKHPMNTEELRSAFSFSETLNDRIRSYRRDRVALIQSSVAPLPIRDGPIAVLHLMPLISIADPPLLKFADHEITAWPFGSGSGANFIETLDGKAIYSGSQSATDPVRAYTLQFRTGPIESVTNAGSRTENGFTRVDVGHLEQNLVEYIPRYLSYLEKKGIPNPYYLFLSLLNVQSTIYTTVRSHGDIPTVQRRKSLMFPELVLNEVRNGGVLQDLLKPLCDLLWNAFGFPRSYNFTPEGKWKPWT